MTQTSAVPPCIFHAVSKWNQNQPPSDAVHQATFESGLSHAREFGFDALLVPLPSKPIAGFPELLGGLDDQTDSTLAEWASQSAQANLALYVDIDIARVAAQGDVARQFPHAYHPANANGVIDPRLSAQDNASAYLRFDHDQCDPAVIEYWTDKLGTWHRQGIAGARLRRLNKIPANVVTRLIAALRVAAPDLRLLGDTAGATPHQLNALSESGLDAVFSSLPWWDLAAPWLVEEQDRLARVAPVTLSHLILDSGIAASAGAEARVWAAAQTGQSMMVGFAEPVTPALGNVLKAAVAWRKSTEGQARSFQQLTGSGTAFTALFRGDGLAYPDAREAPSAATLLVINPDLHNAVTVDWRLVHSRLPGGYGTIVHHSHNGAPVRLDLPGTLPPGAALMLSVRREPPVIAAGTTADQTLRVRHALAAPRIAIEAITPTVDDGRFALKRTVGEPITVEADVFMDGHDHLAIALQWRAVDEIGWHSVPMVLLTNDRYTATFAASRIGRHEFKVLAWRDAWDTYRDELNKKHAAQLDLALELEEGRILIADTLAHLPGNETKLKQTLSQLLDAVGQPAAQGAPMGHGARRNIPPMNVDHVALLLSDETALHMNAAAMQPYASESAAFPVNVERQAAKFASWYELFPRSMSGSTDRHGTFEDVMTRLPAIRDMGFDVLYFPPIHPIGLSNRKGKNNTLNAGADQPGSPYAIGSPDGGHADIHPELGTLGDFQKLIDAAHAHGLEIALDFAIQCSPDHPWLTSHPDWFAWRADGSMRYAENPPKKYQDIVNVDFYSATADGEERAALWLALRDVVLFWAEHGVRTFRVDNPHTKPLPFWEWMIAEVQAQYPDTLFLSEAFTRPKMMYRLAKAGFSQSYTYFTWRETKAELSEYLLELNRAPARDIFRPNFFVNTPDINPHFLQRSGRAGFLIRMALATTTSGLWGMYSGFELCDAEPMPGKEEYLNSEKYEVRAWDWAQPGNIIAEMTAMNLIRRRNPALQSHLGFQLETVYDDQILLFTKSTPERDNVVLVAVSVDPFNTHRATFELPLWSFGLPDDGEMVVTDLVAGNTITMRGKYQTVELTPDAPYAVWRLR